MTMRTRNVAWLTSIALYALCWMLPILDNYLGYEGALLAHKEFWKLLTEGRSIDSLGKVFETIFIAVGWLANELYVVGLVVVLFSPRIAVRFFAFALSIMISWQIGFLDEFPLLVGYWFWALAGGMALWLAAKQQGENVKSPVKKILAEPTTIALLTLPVLNAAILAGVRV